MSSEAAPKVKSRNEAFAERVTTRIWEETPTAENPYIAESCRCHGYDLTELMQRRSFVDVLYLLFRGELPTPESAQLLEQLMIALINPGPRAAAVRAAMNAGVGKTDPAYILPIGLTIHGGAHLGATEVEAAIYFIRKNMKSDPDQCVAELLDAVNQPAEGDWHIAPGFGSRYGGIDRVPTTLAEQLTDLPGSGAVLQWGCQFAQSLNSHNMGWLTTGVAAAALSDLGFQPRVAIGLYQMISAPGIFAHGVELANKPRTAMPHISDNNYIIENE